MKSIKILSLAFLIAIIGGITGVIVTHTLTSEKQVAEQQETITPSINFANYAPTPSGSIDFIEAANSTVNGVVHVKVVSVSSSDNMRSMDPFRDFFRYYDRGPRKSQSSGSGVIIKEDGYIVTNNHVIKGATEIEVTLNDNRTYSAEVVGTDPSTDLAVIKIDEKKLPTIPYANSDEVVVGQWVLAVGNPFNLTSTVTAGIISAKARNINILPNQQYAIESFIQTDAAVNPGNSGGALVNTRGELVGINTAIASSTGSYAGYSFAIPVNLVNKSVEDLIEYGQVQRGFIGVNIRTMDANLAEELDIKNMQGVYVAGLSEGGAAADAGIKEGDIITKIEGKQVNTAPELQEQVGNFRPGNKITVSLLRDNRVRNFEVKLRNKNGNLSLIKAKDISTVLGAHLEDASREEKERLGINNGVKIEELTSGKLKEAGIKQGFIITSIDKQKVGNANQEQAKINKKEGDLLKDGKYPNGMKGYYGFGL
ncbi:MAG: Do family serine endopeptidase [Bacteroidia bacterium]|nr:Do family serine endopeptidase [Bacteroidia bacterium]